MADNDREKQATCPICGYTDTALDATALESAMTEHMKNTHNVTVPVNAASTNLKETGRSNQDDAAFPDVPGSIVAPGNNVGSNRPL